MLLYALLCLCPNACMALTSGSPAASRGGSGSRQGRPKRVCGGDPSERWVGAGLGPFSRLPCYVTDSTISAWHADARFQYGQDPGSPRPWVAEPAPCSRSHRRSEHPCACAARCTAAMREAARPPKLLTAACSTAMQCVVRTNPETRKREVAGTHWDFDLLRRLPQVCQWRSSSGGVTIVHPLPACTCSSVGRRGLVSGFRVQGFGSCHAPAPPACGSQYAHLQP